MRYPAIHDFLDFTLTSPTLAAAQTLSLRIKQEPSRLEGILLQFTPPNYTTTAVVNTAHWTAGLVKEIRLKINDVLGPRNVVQVKGPALLSWNRQLGLSQDRGVRTQFLQFGAAISPTAVTNVPMGYFIPLRHPLFAEPFGNLLSVPLNRLKEDAILEVDLGVAADIGGTPPTLSGNAALRAILVYRKAPLDLPYVPSELRTDAVTYGATGQYAYEFASSGYLTGCMLSNFTSATARGTVLSAGGLYSVEYGRTIIRRVDDNGGVLVSDLSIQENPPNQAFIAATPGAATPNLSAQLMPNEFMLDFLTDYPWSDAFSVGSILDLNPQALNGDKLRIYVRDVAASGRSTWFTQHRLMNQNPDDLKLFAAGI